MVEYYLHIPFVTDDDHLALLLGSEAVHILRQHLNHLNLWDQPQVTRRDAPGVRVTISNAQVDGPFVLSTDPVEDDQPASDEPEPLIDDDIPVDFNPEAYTARGYGESLDQVLARYIPAR
jgi:hypothetical protein